MALPINIDDLLNKQKIESNRIEFKRGWNPDKIYHTICAFATDLDNTGGGYILVGVEQDDNGIAKRPVKGLPIEDIDSIMQDMVGYDAKITTSNLRSITYNSRVSKEEVDGQYILVIWVPTGPNRPYCVPESVVTKGKSPLKYYIRSKASTIEARGETLDEVRALADRTPFDERGNDAIKIEDISDILVYEHLKAVKSKLTGNFIGRPLMEVLDEMDLLVGPVENRSIKNVAAMMFSEHPEKFFPVTQVDIVIFPEGSVENPDLMIEVPKITGPVPRMIKETLSYLRTNVIKKQITKPSDDEKSKKIYNYPYQAFEEAVVNALYHRDYQEREPVEITIEPAHIDILSYAGPDRSISSEAIKAARKLKARRYRNRRLGDFLKELDLTEGRATGIPTIQKSLKDNGSERAAIETDEDRTYFLMTFPCHPSFVNVPSKQDIDLRSNYSQLEQILGQTFVQVEESINQSIITKKDRLGQILEQMFVQVWNKSKSVPNVPRLSQATIDLLCLLKNDKLGAKILNSAIGIGETYELKRKILIPLINLGYVEMTAPDKPTSAKQTYKLTSRGEELFNPE
ncbi:MAG: transcriptional regulator [Bacteroidales bacterium]|nr:transcriptional regulator [Bacteroidales bacterium]